MNNLKKLSAFLLLCATVFVISCTVEPYEGTIPDPYAPVDPAILPALTTIAPNGVYTTTASSGGNITADGGSPVTQRGVVWSTHQHPTTAGSKTIDGAGTGAFSSAIAGLTSNTTYYVRAYAKNANGTSYGNELTFTTVNDANLPVLTTREVEYLGGDMASGGGDISSDGGYPVTMRGVVFSELENPTLADHVTVAGPGIGGFPTLLTGLATDKRYYARAYATNSAGTAYGNQVTFETYHIYHVGDLGPAGGFVFSVDATGQHGMEIAPASGQFQTQWGCYSTSIPGTSNAVGAGQANTNLILDFHNSIGFYSNPAQCQTYVAPVGVITSMGDVAAKNCDNYTLNGFSDWYLPSSGELLLVYTNLQSQGLGDFTYSLTGSTESTNGDVKMVEYISFSSGNIANQGKYNLVDYRAVRGF